MLSTWLPQGTLARAYLGYPRCRICNQDNGNVELTDGIYVWPSGLAHCVDDHAVRLPAEVVAHALSLLGEIESADIDDDWWRSITAG